MNTPRVPHAPTDRDEFTLESWIIVPVRPHHLHPNLLPSTMADTVGLVSAIIQIVAAVRDVAEMGTNIAKSGSPDPILSDKADNLSKFATGLRDVLARQTSGGDRPTKQQEHLRKIAEECVETATSYAAEVKKLGNGNKSAEEVDASKARRCANLARQAVMARVKRAKFAKLAKKMDHIAKAMNTGILLDLW